MKKILLAASFAFLAFSCNSDDDNSNEPLETAALTFKFTQNWDGEEVSPSDFGVTTYTNANGEVLNINRLRYLISDITLQKQGTAAVVVDGYNLVDAVAQTNTTYDPTLDLPAGTYNLSFTFGFTDEDNIDGEYADLNSASWNVPMMMGGGYHYMQMEGMYTNDIGSLESFQYHTIRAADLTNPDILTIDTSFTVNLGEVTITDDAVIEIKMNIAEWFKTPNLWDLNVLNSNLMGNFNAQLLMSENGKDAFRLGSVSQ